MTVFKSRISKSSPEFEVNRQQMLALIGQLRSLEERATTASNKRAATFEKRGQLTPRQRLAALLDPGMPFLRLHSIANYLVDNPDPEKSVPGASVICGIGFVGPSGGDNVITSAVIFVEQIVSRICSMYVTFNSVLR